MRPDIKKSRQEIILAAFFYRIHAPLGRLHHSINQLVETAVIS
jgi:hypothetical protein